MMMEVMKLVVRNLYMLYHQHASILVTTHYDKYDPTRAGRYIELPEWIKLKKACINIKNKDQKCFKYCIQFNL